MKDSFSDRLTNIMSIKDISQTKLAKLTGITQSSISDYINNRYKPKQDKIDLLAQALNTTPAYLMGWEDETKAKPQVKYYKVPVYGSIAAGIPICDLEDPEDFEEVDERTFNRGELVAFRVRGNSMEPRICNGDVVIIREQSTFENGDICAVTVEQEYATLKKMKKDRKGIYLIPLNATDYDTKFYSNEEIEELPVRIVGKMIELRGKF